MLALGAVLMVPIVMWLGQSALLWQARLPLRLRISAADLPRPLKRVNRLVTQAAFAAALLGYPLLRGQSPLTYYLRFFPLGPRPLELLRGAAAAILYLTLLYLAWTVSSNVQFRARHDARQLVRRLAGAPLTAVFIALVEELLFRAVLLAGLLDSFAPRIALPVGILVFAAAHYVRRVKRYWTFPGHVALGTLFCVAFVCAGESLWLPLGLHAGGVLVLMSVRPLIRYTGPGWLVGASIFPYAGVVGIVALMLLTLNIWLSYEGAP
jgi:membrane protease YdiL (CAAX protease family)